LELGEILWLEEIATGLGEVGLGWEGGEVESVKSYLDSEEKFFEDSNEADGCCNSKDQEFRVL
jgi:hypothetical protein